MLSGGDQGLLDEVCRAGNSKDAWGGGVVFATRGIMKEWGEILKRKSMRFHTQVSWTTGLWNHFLREVGDASLLET